nr:hypothetical protein [Streptomyces sp. NRRL WC-3618]
MRLSFLPDTCANGARIVTRTRPGCVPVARERRA